MKRRKIHSFLAPYKQISMVELFKRYENNNKPKNMRTSWYIKHNVGNIKHVSILLSKSNVRTNEDSLVKERSKVCKEKKEKRKYKEI